MKQEEAVKFLSHIADEMQEALEKSRVPRRQWTYEKRIEAISAAISALREQCVRDATKTSDWISVGDSLPEEYKRVLVFIPDQSEIVGKPALDTDRIVKGRWVRWGKYVTHWMPLPEPPEEET